MLRATEFIHRARDAFLGAVGQATGHDPVQHCLDALERVYAMRDKMVAEGCRQRFVIMVRNDEGTNAEVYHRRESFDAARQLIESMPQNRKLGFLIQPASTMHRAFSAEFLAQGVRVQTRQQWQNKSSSFLPFNRPIEVAIQARNALTALDEISNGDRRKIRGMNLV